MEISIKEVNDVKIINLEGNLDTNTAKEAQIQLDKLVSDGVNKILVDLEKLEYMSSAGLRILLTIAKKLKTSEGSLKICCLNETVQEVFDISGFSNILNVYNSESDALKDF